MAEEIRCPTCGGLLFSDDVEAMTLSPCTCTESTKTKTVQAAKAVENTSVLASLAKTLPATNGHAGSTKKPRPMPPESVEPAAPVVLKLCFGCGKNLAGHRRFKDSKGNYWCHACSKKNDEEKEKVAADDPNKASCSRCGTRVMVQNLLAYDGQFVCPKCHRELKEIEKQADVRLKKINEAFKGKDYKRFIPYFAVLALLGLIILLRLFGFIGT